MDLILAPAIENTGRIINELKADLLCLVEVERRPVLRRFNETQLKEAPYRHAILTDGNNERGIDVGMLSRRPLLGLRSHMDDLETAQCEIDVPGTHHFRVLVNHSKSRGYESKKANDARRRRQAETVATILRQFDLRKQFVIVAGDFNELPSSDSLAPLLKLAGLRNAFEKLPNDADRWTHRDDAIRARTIRSITCPSPKGSGRASRRSGSSAAASGRRAEDAREISAARDRDWGQQFRQRPRSGLGGFLFLKSA